MWVASVPHSIATEVCELGQHQYSLAFLTEGVAICRYESALRPQELDSRRGVHFQPYALVMTDIDRLTEVLPVYSNVKEFIETWSAGSQDDVAQRMEAS